LVMILVVGNEISLAGRKRTSPFQPKQPSNITGGSSEVSQNNDSELPSRGLPSFSFSPKSLINSSILLSAKNFMPISLTLTSSARIVTGSFKPSGLLPPVPQK
ncbi:hypothetical protein ACTBWJ_004931, partial [Shigella flexneri]